MSEFKTREGFETWQLILIGAAAIVKHVGWTKGSFAQTRNGLDVKIEDPHAVKFCQSGARTRAIHELEQLGVEVPFEDRVKARAAIRLACGDGMDSFDFNDRKSTKRQDVVDMLIKAVGVKLLPIDSHRTRRRKPHRLKGTPRTT